MATSLGWGCLLTAVWMNRPMTDKTERLTDPVMTQIAQNTPATWRPA